MDVEIALGTRDRDSVSSNVVEVAAKEKMNLLAGAMQAAPVIAAQGTATDDSNFHDAAFSGADKKKALWVTECFRDG
tara:strand:- start:1179 stop:1409 length:231 start_codon:yes stop_codon:yes gene_type:complete